MYRRGRGFGFNNGRGRGFGSSRGRNNNVGASFRERIGGGNERSDEASVSHRNNTPPKLSAFEIKKLQEKTAITNFSSSELSYKGSDHIVYITNGRSVTTVWKKILKRETSWNQDDVRIFVSSALVTTDSQTGVEELVKELGNPESGLKRLKEIIKFPFMSCDAGLKNGVLSFQHVILPFLGLLTRSAITECILEKYVHAIFMVVYTNLDSFLYNKVMKMLEELMQRNSIKDNLVSAEELLSREPYSFIPSSLGIFFLVIVRLLTELLRRIKEASINETMRKIAHDLQRLMTTYKHSIEQQQLSFTSTDPLVNSLETRKYFFAILEREMKIMYKMLNGLVFKQQNLNAKSKLTQLHYKEIARKADVKRTYDPPGELSENGKRHDNDFAKISEISIIPTREEIICDRQPFLPSSLPDAPHFLPSGVNRLLDTQFRLLREDILNPIRGGISSFLAALLQDHTDINTNLSRELEKIKNGGGKFRYNNGMNDNGDLNVYTNIQFVEIVCDRRGFFCTIKFTPPKLRSARDFESRKAYWKTSKNLIVGSLVTFILPNLNSNFRQASSNNTVNNFDLYSLYFGVVASRDENALAGDDAKININLIDPSCYTIALDDISYPDKLTKKYLERRFMVESTSVYLEAYYHILKNLQTIDSSSLPFEQYLAPNLNDLIKNNDDSVNVKVENPVYTRAPGFQFDLSVLFKDKRRSIKLNVADSYTYDDIARYINNYSSIGKSSDGTPYGLDETQAKALISALTREIALIEGPPGTGKTVVGVQIMKVLLAKENRTTRIGPILIICFTNHALDQFLEHLLDENITKNIVRLGSRTNSKKIENYKLENYKTHSKLPGSLIESLEEIEHEVSAIKSKERMSWNDIREYLKINEAKFFSKFKHVTNKDLPNWILLNQEKIFEQWLKGTDIKKINKTKNNLYNHQKEPNKNEDHENIETDADDESLIDYETMKWIENYNEPKTNRALDVLLNDHAIWKMSRVERKKLHDYWRTKHYEKIFSDLQKRYQEKLQEKYNIYNEGRRQVLLNSDVIGMTTNGAAKFQSLIRSIGPKIIVCEEAGEVLEAHILSALTPSTQHLILIGDHNQLRPHIATYSLSMDSHVGKNYQLDKSVFERLVDGNNAVKIEKTRILTQRRMRNEISDLIRYTLYPNLIDGENTAKYKNVRGAQHNVYFIDHRNPEDSSGGDLTTQSHVNSYEVTMVVEMVKYFVRNGYDKPDDIAVLTPYLGQMNKIKEALSKPFAVTIDKREEQDIVEMEEEQGDEKNDDKKQKVTLRTVDNFQGEEARIVIISLVRNFSGSGKYESIGFLKSSNRSNVLLSRAREGMYLIGNSELMAKKSEDMWAPVIDILHKRNPSQVGFGMPIVCNRHPDYKHIITEPEQFAKVSPNGGCDKNCDISLPCGHACTQKCHSDDLNHKKLRCLKPCSKLYPNCGHPCIKSCFEDCGKCEFYVGDITLPVCDHIFKNAKCWQNQSKEEIECEVLIDIELPNCGHKLQNIEYGERPKCKVPIDITLPDCGHLLPNIECWKIQNGEIPECNVPIVIVLPSCGHLLQIECWKNEFKEEIDCITLIDIKLPNCGHILQDIECWKIQNGEIPECDFPIDNIILPICGHTLQNAKCWQNQIKEKLRCNYPVDIKLPNCDHTLQHAECWQNQIKEQLLCKVPIDNTLSCGHKLRNVECWENQFKESVRCMELVTKKLPYCEHTKDIHCYESVDDIECREICGEKMKCGHECLNKCFECQSSKIATLEELRKPHGKCKNTCNSLLFCGDLCKQICHEGYECQPCKNRCTVLCEHKKSCRKNCLEPCSVCAEKCSWECKHQGRCELSCGVPCSRLPCNERCDKKLKCGHRCAGVCGEICPSKDFCVECARENVKNQVSDTITNTIFSETDWNKERMIVLSCKHVYTMKTMDILMKMKDYYEGSNERGWTSTKIISTLPINIIKCPACQIPVKDIRRYGRIIKKCTLNIQNKKFLLKYDYKIKEIIKNINFDIGNKIKSMRCQLNSKLPKLELRPREVVFKEHNITSKDLPEITPYYYFESIEEYHGFDEVSEQVWINHVKKLLICYRELTTIIRATKISPHVKAFEATVSSLLKLPKSVTSESLQQETLSKIGIILPRINRRIYLDAFLEIINIQKILYHEILIIIEIVSRESRNEDKDFISIKNVWKNFAESLQNSIQKHLYTIREVAKSTHYGRNLLLTNVEILELDLKMLTFQLKYQTNGIIINNALKKCTEIKKSIVDIVKNDEYKKNKKEFKTGVYKRLQYLWRDCNKIVENLNSGIERELEIQEIHQSMKPKFISAGLWYKWYECSNGHLYMLEECSKPVRCPDCDLEIDFFSVYTEKSQNVRK
ncbi:hypothetical protein C1645_866307 [Glomus cerebriforme]|uniref:P-loop containing nucleoside triphosphate hydrolase protein n=1 Tax=Glomus cerebriforme TaxID=658196 RepID=A0A397SDA4_9GLOM|nr:hypothetical protein C1645_866307 [Glomus cerebriforme]